MQFEFDVIKQISIEKSNTKFCDVVLPKIYFTSTNRSTRNRGLSKRLRWSAEHFKANKGPRKCFRQNVLIYRKVGLGYYRSELRFRHHHTEKLLIKHLGTKLGAVPGDQLRYCRPCPRQALVGTSASNIFAHKEALAIVFSAI